MSDDLFQFQCPTCKKWVAAKTKWVGRRVICPHCKWAIEIPSEIEVVQLKHPDSWSLEISTPNLYRPPNPLKMPRENPPISDAQPRQIVESFYERGKIATLVTLSADEFAAHPDLLGVGINISSPDQLTVDQLEKILAGVAFQLVKNRIVHENDEDEEGDDDQLALFCAASLAIDSTTLGEERPISRL